MRRVYYRISILSRGRFSFSKKDSLLFAQVREKCRLRAAGTKGPFSFAKENGPFGTPRERLRLSVSGLKDSYASGMKMPARGFAAFRAAIRFASASIIRCRSAYLVDVRILRRAQQSRPGRQKQICTNP